METVEFPLFRDGGFVNPTRISPPVWDFDCAEWRQKQGPSFDGGWRWFHRYDGDSIVIYNTQLHKQACHVLSTQELEDSIQTAEFELQCAQAHVMVEHNFFTSRDWLHNKIRADFRKLHVELFGDKVRAR